MKCAEACQLNLHMTLFLTFVNGGSDLVLSIKQSNALELCVVVAHFLIFNQCCRELLSQLVHLVAGDHLCWVRRPRHVEWHVDQCSLTEAT